MEGGGGDCRCGVMALQWRGDVTVGEYWRIAAQLHVGEETNCDCFHVCLSHNSSPTHFSPGWGGKL